MLKGSLVAFFSRVSGLGLRYFNNILLARLLGAHLMGFYSLGTTVVSVFAAFSTFGLSNPTIRLSSTFSKDNQRLKGLVVRIGGFSILGGIVGMICLLLLSKLLSLNIFHKPELAKILPMLALAIVFSSITSFSLSVLQGLRMGYLFFFIENVVTPSLAIIIFVSLFTLGYGINSAVFAFILSALISATIASLLLFKKVPMSVRHVYPEKMGIFKDASQFYLITIQNRLIAWIDVLIIGAFRPAAEVAIYAVALRTAMLVSLPLQSVNLMFTPEIVDYHRGADVKGLEAAAQKNSRLIFTFSLPIVCILALLSKEIMSIFGKDFLYGATALIILSIGQLVNAFTGSVGAILRMTENQKYIIMAKMVVITISIALYLLFVPQFGIIAAAIISSLVFISVNVWNSFNVYKIFKIIICSKDILRPISYSIIGMVCFFIGSKMVNQAVGILLFGLSYSKPIIDAFNESKR